MIYLTGDVHSKLPGHWEQEIGGSELESTKTYLKILKRHKLSCTLFLNGKLLDEKASQIKELLNYDIEIGGHTYDNFGRMNIFKSYFNRKWYGCVYGSNSFQEKDIKKTKNAFEKFGLKMNSWRTHAFGSNKETFKILRNNNIKYVSDFLGYQKPFEDNGIIHMPINIPVDVVTIAYGSFRPENRDSFASCTKGRIDPLEWLEIVKKRIIQNEKQGIDSILLIHPITMKVMDDFKLFEEIAKFLSKYKSKKISEFSIN